ncbi:MAG: hypothetical protein Kilf2KO_42870 [Rhodospirillales bacterium]
MLAATKSPPQGEPNQALLDVVLASLDDDKADDVVVIELYEKSSLADFMVIASGRSSRQVSTMAEHLAERMKPFCGDKTPPSEGMTTADWVLVDGGDVIVHLFRPEVRDFYNLEKMWSGPSEASERSDRILA